ncbi:hypothetical protein JW964_11640 [candidate division KSB1 bacterium]|nr:hypothetical protein [candidate division KSB1 bacterium]
MMRKQWCSVHLRNFHPFSHRNTNRHARMLLSGIQILCKMDSRQKHAGMTDSINSMNGCQKLRANSQQPEANRRHNAN